MKGGGFEWDEWKAAANYARHGVSFAAARDVFKDPFAIEQLDDREDYGEGRYIVIGSVEGRLLSVAYTMRGETIRIISARGAEPHEQRRCHEDNG
ncbi:MAG: BrnT family toxin [Beijerinckiaceae bacterium]